MEAARLVEPSRRRRCDDPAARQPGGRAHRVRARRAPRGGRRAAGGGPGPGGGGGGDAARARGRHRRPVRPRPRTADGGVDPGGVRPALGHRRRQRAPRHGRPARGDPPHRRARAHRGLRGAERRGVADRAALLDPELGRGAGPLRGPGVGCRGGAQPTPARDPGDAEERLVRFAELVDLAVRNASRLAELESRAASDALTGLANKRSFEEDLANEFERAAPPPTQRRAGDARPRPLQGRERPARPRRRGRGAAGGRPPAAPGGATRATWSPASAARSSRGSCRRRTPPTRGPPPSVRATPSRGRRSPRWGGSRCRRAWRTPPTPPTRPVSTPRRTRP